jgi:hypothetical protein
VVVVAVAACICIVGTVVVSIAFNAVIAVVVIVATLQQAAMLSITDLAGIAVWTPQQFNLRAYDSSARLPTS